MLVTQEEKLYMLFKEDYHARQIFEFLRVETVKDLEQFSPQQIVKLLSQPIQKTVLRIRRSWPRRTGTWPGTRLCVEYKHACWTQNDGHRNNRFMDVRPHEQRPDRPCAEAASWAACCATRPAGATGDGTGRTAGAMSSAGCSICISVEAGAARSSGAVARANLHLVCTGRSARGSPLDAAALCFGRQGDAELTRDLLQAGHERLAIGGRLAAAIDNPRDQWLHEQLRAMFDKVTRRPNADAVVYLATKTRPLKKHKDYACELAFRDGERLIHLRTRPGVFSHREVDGGARALVKSMQIEPGQRVLDLGCGSGAVGIAAALRAEEVQVHAIDSNPRAIEAVQLGRRAKLAWPPPHRRARLRRQQRPAGTFDLVLANPPYYSNFRLAALFVAIAHRALQPGGKLLVVTKTPQWYRRKPGQAIRGDVETRASGQYSRRQRRLATLTRRAASR